MYVYVNTWYIREYFNSVIRTTLAYRKAVHGYNIIMVTCMQQ